MQSLFADPRLELAVRAAMPQDVLAQPLSSLTRLDAAELGIRRLRGIEQLTELRWLDLASNPLLGVSELVANTKLIRLRLAHTGTSTLSGLAGLPDLEDLDLYGSRVVSIDEVASLPALRSLDLGLCIVSDLAPLSRLTRLESLTLGNPSLHIRRRLMYSSSDPVELDLSSIEQLHSLRQLRLHGVRIRSFDFLAELVGLEELVLDRSSLAVGLRGFPRLPRLEVLSLADCEIGDLAPLVELPRLRALQLDAAKFHDLDALAGCESLESLSVREIHLNEFQIQRCFDRLPRLSQVRGGNHMFVR